MQDNFLHYVLDRLFQCMHWVLVSIYFVIKVIFQSNTDEGFFKWFVFWFLLGLVISTLYKGWRKKESGGDEALDLEHFENDKEEVLGNPIKDIWLKLRKQFKGFRDTPFWIKLHWVLVCGFLGLTFYFMLEGLKSLFKNPGGSPSRFIIVAFTSLVTLSLFWLVIRISKSKKNMGGYIIFYIIFDLFTAFQFNFIDFYDNVSYRESMERDMKACNYYLGHQRNAASAISSIVEQERAAIDSTFSQIYKGKQRTALKTAESLKQISQSTGVILNIDSAVTANAKTINQKSKKENELYNRQVSLGSMLSLVSTIDSLEKCVSSSCNSYEKDPNNFSIDSLDKAKKYVNQLHENILLAKDSIAKKYNRNIDVSNDSINWVLSRLKKDRGDKFGCIDKLVSLLDLKDSDKEDLARRLDPSQIAVDQKSEVAVQLAEDEQKFENRLLIQSISLSVVIDVLPLALGIFVAYVRRRGEEE